MFQRSARSAAVAIGLLSSVAQVLSAQAVTAQAVSARDRAADLNGTYVVQADAQIQLREAVERAVAALNFVVRPVARRRLLALNQPSSRVEILVRGDSVILRYSNQPELRAQRRGATGTWQNSAGETLTVELRAPTQAADSLPWLFERYIAEDGRRENRWFIDPATNRARLEVTVSSPRLPAPLRLQLIYTRSAAAGGAK